MWCSFVNYKTYEVKEMDFGFKEQLLARNKNELFSISSVIDVAFLTIRQATKCLAWP